MKTPRTVAPLLALALLAPAVAGAAPAGRAGRLPDPDRDEDPRQRAHRRRVRGPLEPDLRPLDRLPHRLPPRAEGAHRLRPPLRAHDVPGHAQRRQGHRSAGSIEGGGGVLNGSTRYDYTNYISSAPVSALDAILWLEADRMKALDFSAENLKNQQDVVKEEIRVNVKNRPYGLFFWTDLAGKAFDKWEQRPRRLRHASRTSTRRRSKTSRSFFDAYYGPGQRGRSAIAGDVTPGGRLREGRAATSASMPARPVPARRRTSRRSRLNTAERTLEQTDALASVPGDRGRLQDAGPRQPKDHVAGRPSSATCSSAGEASRLYQGLVKGKELLLQVQGGVNWPLGERVDATERSDAARPLRPLQANRRARGRWSTRSQRGDRDDRAGRGSPPPSSTRVKTKMKSDFYSDLEMFINRADVDRPRPAPRRKTPPSSTRSPGRSTP